MKQPQSEVLQYWKNSAADALDTAEELFTAKKYHHSLFFLHLTIEKLLKALHQKRKNEPAPLFPKTSAIWEMAAGSCGKERGVLAIIFPEETSKEEYILRVGF